MSGLTWSGEPDEGQAQRVRPPLWRRRRFELVALCLAVALGVAGFQLRKPDMGLRAGSRVPELSLQMATPEGGELKLPGTDPEEVTVLTFFTSWCRTCRTVIPAMDSYAVTEEVHWVGVSVEGTIDSAREIAGRWKLRHPTAWDAKGVVSDALQIRAFPTVVVVAGDGTLIGSFVGQVEEPVLKQQVAMARQSTD